MKTVVCAAAACKKFDLKSYVEDVKFLPEVEKEVSKWIASDDVQNVSLHTLENGMAKLRHAVEEVWIAKLEHLAAECGKVKNGKPNGGNWRNDITSDDIDGWKAAADRHILQVSFAQSLRTSLNDLLKVCLSFHAPPLPPATPQHKFFCSCYKQIVGFKFLESGFFFVLDNSVSHPRQVSVQVKKIYEMLELPLPAIHKEAMGTAAQLSGTMAEIVLITAMTKMKNTDERRERLDGCFQKVKQQSSTYGVPVQPLMHQPLVDACTAWLLNN